MVHFLIGFPNTFCLECYRVPCIFYALAGRFPRKNFPAMLFKKLFAPKPSHIDCKLFDERFADARRYLDVCDYRVDSTDLPRRFIIQWQMPMARGEHERRRLRALFQTDEPGVLIQLPLVVFDYVWQMRYDRGGDVPPDPGMTDGEELLRLLDKDPRLRAEVEYFDRRFMQFQELIRYIFTMTVLRREERMRRFYLFDVDFYDEVIRLIDGDGAAGELPDRPVIF